jgi:hypothetical protein
MTHFLVQSADFFRADNPEGMEARNEVNLHEHDLLLLVDYMIVKSFKKKKFLSVRIIKELTPFL